MSTTSRNKINFYIDLAMFMVMGALIGIGLLIKYVLIPGSDRWLVYGQNIDLTFWGLDRHEWGTIHLILGGVFFVLLILHLVFHWKQITCLFRRYIMSVQSRRVLAVLTVVLFLLLASFPLLVTPEKELLDRGEGRRSLENMGVDLNDSIRIRLKKPRQLETGDLEMEVERKRPKSEIEVKGSMTLGDVSRQFDIELSVLREELDLPENVSADERLGRLRKQYTFTIGDVKAVVMKHRERE